MPAGTGQREAVRQAKERLGDVSPQQMADFIQVEFGLVLQPVAVKVLLASLRERELLQASWLRVQGDLQAALAEQAEQAERRKARRGPRG